MGVVKNLFPAPRLAALLAGSFVLLGCIYSIVTPPFEASDELWHYPMVKTLADGNGLPIQDSRNPGPWRQEGSQPPLYYAISAATTFWIDTSNITEVRRLNPHVDKGIVTKDGNTNLVVHNAAGEAWPWRGTALAVHIVRFISVIMGAGTVLLTCLIGLEIFPARTWIALAGAAVVAFTPMFAFISGSINNDNLGVLLSTAAVWIILRLIRLAHGGGATIRWSLALGVVLGLAALSKQSALGLFALSGIALGYVAWHRRQWQTLVIEGLLILALALLIGAWWYYRNWVLYQDPTGLNVFLDIVGRRSPPATLEQLWGEREGFLESYWGLFGGVNVPMETWIYVTLNALALTSVPGAVTFLVQRARREGLQLTTWVPALISVLWIPGVVIPLVAGWTRFTTASQGRLIFSAIGPISLWFMAGLCGWLPDQWGKVAACCTAALMAVIAFSAPFVWIAPRYRLPSAFDASTSNASIGFAPSNKTDSTMRLIHYEVDTSETEPSGNVELKLAWQARATMDRNWSVFVHLVDSTGLIVAQRDKYPGSGLMATMDLTPGRTWQDTYVIPIGGSAYSPETLQVVIGIYDLETGERMSIPGKGNSLTIGTVRLKPRITEASVPNPITINFGNELELGGYSVATRQVSAGQSLQLSTFWQALYPLKRDYTLSVQILNAQFQKYGQQDQRLIGEGQSTSQWIPSTMVKMTSTIDIAPDTPSGVYDVRLIVYWIDNSGVIQRLQIVSGDRILEPFLNVMKIRVAQ